MSQEERPEPLDTLPRDLREHLEMEESDEEQDNFQDASGDVPDENMDLQMALADCEMAIKRFFNNDLESAMGIMKSRSSSSIYHSLGVSIFEFIPAVLTLDSAQVGRAIQSLKTTVQLCNQHRRSYTIMQTIGTMITKEAGLAELQTGAREPGLRGVLCEIVSLGIQLVVSHFAGATPNFHQCREIIDAQLKVYPEGVWFLLFEGRLELLRGRCALAAATYRRVAETRHLWPQLRHLCYWELMWASAMMMDWRTAAEFAGRLIEESSWSRTMYCYAKAALLLQLGEDCTSAERNHVTDLLNAAPLYRQKIAGKSLPMEKWVTKRCARYSAQGGRLMMPAMELLCLWNMMSALAADVPTLQSLLKKIDIASELLDREERLWPSALLADNRALIFYLRGCCLSALGMQLLAIQQFDKVVGLKNTIKSDTFLVPYAMYEAATCHYNLGEVDRAVRMWQDARKGYSNYSLESRLQFRLHSKLEMAQSNAQGQADMSLSAMSRTSSSLKLASKR
ncbi:tetratricopeptide repeat protein 39B isoform X5 [Papilio machaon]|uniref:tetratricopeptide repeat protein 39B isoform X5 n=1 Tax=Papilio machaon TaxID=76193 RepID=UPI001E664A26|nr:tetratricopeptide repeat protein 39B isoform X5 [Papilio machaon]